MSTEAKIVAGMALLRLLSASIEITAALLMLKMGKVTTAVKLNAALGLVGPTILILVSALGIAGLAGKVPVGKIALVAVGVGLIFLAARK